MGQINLSRLEWVDVDAFAGEENHGWDAENRLMGRGVVLGKWEKILSGCTCYLLSSWAGSCRKVMPEGVARHAWPARQTVCVHGPLSFAQLLRVSFDQLLCSRVVGAFVR